MKRLLNPIILLVALIVIANACVTPLPTEGDTNPIAPSETEPPEPVVQPAETPPGDQRYQLIELSEYATILNGPFNIVYDRRASNNLSVYASWRYETMGGSYGSIEPLRFRISGAHEDVSLWVRIYAEPGSEGWRLELPDGSKRDVSTNIVHEYVWVEAYRGRLQDGTMVSMQPLGPRSKVDSVLVTPFRDPSGFDSMLDLTSPRPVPQARYYVGMEGDDRASGDIDAPIRTIQEAVDRAGPGDRILVREGTYAGFSVPRKSGRPDAWITVQAYPGERVIIDAYLPSEHPAGIRINAPSSYWIFDGFEITDSNPAIDDVRRLDLRVESNRITYHEMREAMKLTTGVSNQNVRSGTGNSHLIFRNLEVHRFLRHGFGGNIDHAQYIDNHVHDLGYYGWYSQGDNRVYRGNIIHDTAIGIHAYSTTYPARNMLFENNLLFRNGKHPFLHSSGSLKSNGQAFVIITTDTIPENNTIINSIFIYNGNGIEDRSKDGLIANNIFIGNGLETSSPYSIRLTRSGIRVINNVFYENKRNIRDDGSGNTYRTNSETSVPVYHDPYKLDFTIRAGASIIDSGTQLSEVTADFYGTVRPQGRGWNIGAVE